MNLSISNIAWDASFEPQVIDLLLKNGIHHLDFAPGKFFSDIANTSDADILRVKKEWQDKGFTLAGIQSLLFGTTGLNLFESSTQDRMLEHLKRVCHIGSLTGASRLVFGSPKNRDRSKLDDTRTDEIALDFFFRLGEIAKKENVTVCLEANPTVYGTNFLTTTKEAAAFVRKLNHSNIKLQLDLGTIYTNHEPAQIIEDSSDVIGHIHLSEPSMAPVTTDDPIHREIGDSLKRAISKSLLSTDILTIEMLTNNSDSPENRIKTIEESIKDAKELYMQD